MERELYCASCDQVYINRAEHYRKIKPDSWMAVNVPIMPPIEFENPQELQKDIPEPIVEKRRKNGR